MRRRRRLPDRRLLLQRSTPAPDAYHEKIRVRDHVQIQTPTLFYERVAPGPCLEEYVASFWTLENRSGRELECTVLPDGYFDVLIRHAHAGAFPAALSGLWTRPALYRAPAHARCLAVSFKPLAAECLFGTAIAALLDRESPLPGDGAALFPSAVTDFSSFVEAVSGALAVRAANAPSDERKRALFRLLADSHGGLSVKEMGARVFWSPRQINRYFSRWLGIPLKTYAGILRYRASFGRIRDGDLSADTDYADQAHFIREVKRYSGVPPRQLADNKNDRFVQLTTLRNG